VPKTLNEHEQTNKKLSKFMPLLTTQCIGYACKLYNNNEIIIIASYDDLNDITIYHLFMSIRSMLLLAPFPHYAHCPPYSVKCPSVKSLFNPSKLKLCSTFLNVDVHKLPIYKHTHTHTHTHTHIYVCVCVCVQCRPT